MAVAVGSALGVRVGLTVAVRVGVRLGQRVSVGRVEEPCGVLVNDSVGMAVRVAGIGVSVKGSVAVGEDTSVAVGVELSVATGRFPPWFLLS